MSKESTIQKYLNAKSEFCYYSKYTSIYIYMCVKKNCQQVIQIESGDL